MAHSIRLIGHGIDQTFPEDTGFPWYVSSSKDIKEDLKRVYLSVLGEKTDCQLSFWIPFASKSEEVKPRVIQVTREITITVMRQGGDGAWRNDETTSRTFTIIVTHDYTDVIPSDNG